MNRGLHSTIVWLAATAVAAALAGCQQKMADQPSLRPDAPAPFLPNGSASQRPVAGTVARGHLRTDLALFTGKKSRDVPPLPSNESRLSLTAGGGDRQTLEAAQIASYRDVVDEFPLPVNELLVEQGRNRYMIYCVVCHDAVGTGVGKIVERGYARPPSLHIARLRDAPVGHLFRVISEGYGAMPSYAAQIPTRDRWAIVAYVRALQLSQHCPEGLATEQGGPRESGTAAAPPAKEEP